MILEGFCPGFPTSAVSEVAAYEGRRSVGTLARFAMDSMLYPSLRRPNVVRIGAF